MTMMPRGSQLLLPVNPVFIWVTLLLALMLNLLPVGRVPALPDVLAVVLVFWNVHQPRRVGVGAAFVFGLFMDVHDGALLGQHALAYTLLSYFAITVHRRLLWFTVGSQAVQILPLFIAAHAVALLVRLIAGATFPGWGLLAAPLFEAALWPVAHMLLLAPQRRAPDQSWCIPDKRDLFHAQCRCMTHQIRDCGNCFKTLKPRQSLFWAVAGLACRSRRVDGALRHGRAACASCLSRL
jgi:rod shape-determining protein MreD